MPQIIAGAGHLKYGGIGEEQKPLLHRYDGAAALHIVGEGILPDQLVANPPRIEFAGFVQGSIKSAPCVEIAH